MSRAILAFTGAACAALMLLTSVSAEACPQGTRYSSYKKNCYTGTVNDLKIWVKCTRHSNKCPKGTKRQQKLDDDRVVCCATASDKYKFDPIYGEGPEFTFLACYWRGTAPFCDGSCNRGEIAKTASSNGRKMGKFTRSFGEPCVSGMKHLCCQNTHPGR